jgi:excisionase family DNA binding protein
MQTGETVHVGTRGRAQPVAKNVGNRRRLVTSLLQGVRENAGKLACENQPKTAGRGSENRVRLMTVREVAAVLKVCRATVYAMIERGELESVRVSNAIRLVVRG